jgi:hypothetical protein
MQKPSSSSAGHPGAIIFSQSSLLRLPCFEFWLPANARRSGLSSKPIINAQALPKQGVFTNKYSFPAALALCLVPGLQKAPAGGACRAGALRKK